MRRYSSSIPDRQPDLLAGQIFLVIPPKFPPVTRAILKIFLAVTPS